MKAGDLIRLTYEGTVVTEETYTVEPEQDPRTGRWFTACPICKYMVITGTNAGMMDAMIKHMNAAHGGRNQ